MTKYVTIEGGFGNQACPRGVGDGSNPTGGEYTETITGRIMQGAVWHHAAAIYVCRAPGGAAELQEGGGAATSLAIIRSGWHSL